MRAAIGSKSAASFMAAGLMLLAGPAVSAYGQAGLRVVHAVPGAAPASLTVNGIAVGGEATFGGPTPYAQVATGDVTLSALAGESPLARAKGRLRDGRRYTVLLTGDEGRARISLLSDKPAVPGAAFVRMVQAAPEAGEPDLAVGSTTLGKGMRLATATPYEKIDPGTYPLSARVGEMELAGSAGVALSAGSAFTAYLVGSGGERLRFVLAADSTAAPSGAPATGLGGLTNQDPSWLLAALAALVAGALGAGAYRTAAGPRRSRDA